MRTSRFLTLSIILASGACEMPAASLNPLYQEEDLIPASELVGTWDDTDEELIYTFSEVDPGVYSVTIQERDNGQGAYRAVGHTLELDGHAYLDLTADVDVWDDLEGRFDVPFPMVAIHMWFAMEVAGDTARFDVIEHDAWLEELPRQNELVLTFSDASDTDYVLLPHNTEALQSVVARMYADEAHERESLTLVRRPGS